MGEDGLPLDNSPEGRKQRALSGSKRAAQNRAAQVCVFCDWLRLCFFALSC